jgi:hypothetical protein
MRDKNNFSSARFFATSTSILSLFFNALGNTRHVTNTCFSVPANHS